MTYLMREFRSMYLRHPTIIVLQLPERKRDNYGLHEIRMKSNAFKPYQLHFQLPLR